MSLQKDLDMRAGVLKRRDSSRSLIGASSEAIDGAKRGLVERNTMRYSLAVEAFLGAVSAPPQERLEKRLREWFAAIERYPRQLHEMEPGRYFDMKRKEYLRQRSEILRPPA